MTFLEEIKALHNARRSRILVDQKEVLTEWIPKMFGEIDWLIARVEELEELVHTYELAHVQLDRAQSKPRD